LVNDNKDCIHRSKLIGEWIMQQFNKNKKKIYKLLKVNPSGMGTKKIAEELELSISEAYHILSSGVYNQELDAKEDDMCGIVYFII
jgi:orotate phosphoribosyltransferase-like protein